MTTGKPRQFGAFTPMRLIEARRMYDALPSVIATKSDLTEQQIKKLLPHVINAMFNQETTHGSMYHDGDYLMWMSTVSDEDLEDRRFYESDDDV